ncbi:MAG TPA: hypothetical protein DCK95_02305 [Anaerolineaceae bacterium]|nr:hypothetical protein [Anaerolineaceae bacterium]
MTFDKSLSRIFQFLLALFFAITASSAVLGFFRAYNAVAQILLTFVLMLTISPFLIKKGDMHEMECKTNLPGWATILLFVAGVLILVALVLVPLGRWPLSHAGDWYPWDAGAYHFPKAVELMTSGSIWDMSIAYADYPFGYESLLAMALLITGDTALFGFVHVLIVLFFISGFWMLARRITKVDGGLLFFLIVMLLLSDHFFQFLNLWRVFTLDIYTVGKNDLLAAAASLAVIVYFYKTQASFKEGMLGFALASGLAASVKPNTLYVLFPLWLFIIMRFYREKLAALVGYALMLVPGSLWLLRNFIVLGTYASADASRLVEWSIASNLGNPYFYQNIPKNLVLVVIIIMLEILLAWKHKKEHFWNAIIAVVLFIGFISTPVTAYFGATDVPPTINWRFGEALLAFLGVLVMNDLALLLALPKWSRIASQIALGSLLVISVASGGWLIFSQREMMQKVPQNAYIIHDQFPQPVGVDGYYSAYDYVQQNVHHSIVWVENGLPFYTYDAEFSNTVSRQEQADYVVGFRTDWFGEGRSEFPDLIEKLLASQTYEIVYQDTQGIVLHQK